jgi:hypothetical protein
MVKALTTEEFIKRAKDKHGELYDYTKVIYKGYRYKVVIICKKHGEFSQFPGDHMKGNGCSKCSGHLVTINDFIRKAKEKHGEIYDYSKVVYKNARTDIIITCKIHGDFLQLPNNHLQGNGCQDCGYKTLTTNEFIIKSKEKHGERYDYSKAVYKNARTNIIITCKIHGDFLQLPNNHLRYQGCLKCNKGYSKISISWINYLECIINKEIQNIFSPLGEYKIPNTLYKADGYCKETNTIYEFHGDIWHGNPKIFNPNDINLVSKKTYGELYKRTQVKKEKILELGYNYIEIWEQDWVKAIKAVTKIQKIWKKKNYKNGNHLRVV